MKYLTAITTAGSAAALGTAMHERAEKVLAGTKGVEQIARNERAIAERKAALRQSTRKAVNALVKIGQGQIVLGHIQPRWLRQVAEGLLDAGEDVTFERLAELRQAGRPLGKGER